MGGGKESARYHIVNTKEIIFVYANQLLFDGCLYNTSVRYLTLLSVSDREIPYTAAVSPWTASID